MIWKVRGRRFEIRRTWLMGILNITPDSFSDGGLFEDPSQAIAHAIKLVEEGADILDIGAESSRPGAQPVPPYVQIERLGPVLKKCLELKNEVLLSVDTTRHEVAKWALENGAHIINDVSGLTDSGKAMAEVAAFFEAGFVLMHRRGTSVDMQEHAHYENVVEEVERELAERMHWALKWGMETEQIAVDPGLGFSKRLEHNLAILRNLKRWHHWGRPLVIGPSRKSFLGELTGKPVQDREFATAAVVAYAIEQGAHIIRVHDVGKMRDVVKVFEALNREEPIFS